MKLAWKELKYDRKKYVLVEVILVLMVLMVLFLSGLVNGLGRSIIAGIDTMDGDYFFISDDAEELITISKVDQERMEEAASFTESEIAPLNIQRMYLKAFGSEEKLDVTYFAVEPDSFLIPEIRQGASLSNASKEHEIILDTSYQEEGIKLGDQVVDAASRITMTVVEFAKDQMYGHTAVGIISMETYSTIRSALNPSYEPYYHTLVIRGDDIDGIKIDGFEVVSKADIVDNLPGYMAEKTTITMILWVLVVFSAAILGVFFYVMTIQKEKQFGVLKAVGMTMTELCGNLTGQVLILSVCGAAAGNILAFGMAAVLPASMPFYLTAENACVITVVFVTISLASSLFSVLRVASVDPLVSIGGK